ncbi:MAG: putative transcription regulator [Streptosporangiaceae bacterium]|nr:putative transcription regulator [Streptosporangiaceae bacterium]
MGWQDHALCAQVDPELWFPKEGESPRPAKRICQRCPVQAECLADALAHGEQHGVWGGLSYSQRLGRSTRPDRQAESARDHARLITTLSASEAARELDVSARTIQRWRKALHGTPEDDEEAIAS